MKNQVIALLLAKASAVKLRDADAEENDWVNNNRPKTYTVSHYTPADFAADEAKRPWDHTAQVPSTNSGDTAPQHHPMGFSFAEMGPNNSIETTWTNGNGAGSEKFDYFDHLGEETKNSDKFHAHARVPWLTASN